MSFCRVLLVLSLIAAAPVKDLRAQVDQENWPAVIGEGFNSSLELRQEFTPTLNALDSIQVSIGQSMVAPITPWAGSAVVRIFQGGVDGVAIAASSPVYLPLPTSSAVTFRFAESVALTPGQTYAFEMSSLTPGAYWALGASTPGFPGFSPDYPGGRLSFQGRFVDADLLFREGIGIPEPAPWVLIVVGLSTSIAALAWSKGTSQRRTTIPDADDSGRPAFRVPDEQTANKPLQWTAG